MPIPQLGKTHPAILATDDKGAIEAKVLSQLSQLRDALDAHIAEAKESGEADDPGFVPNARVSIPCCYVDEASAGNVHDNATHGLRFALDNLEAYGLFPADVEEWQSVDFTDEDDQPPFPHHEIGVTYAIRVGDESGRENDRRLKAEKLIEGKRRFDAGELNTGGGGDGGIEELLRRLGR